MDDAFKTDFPKSFTVEDSLKYKDEAETQFKNNTYQSDPVAKTETVNVYNLTDSQLTRINKYTTDIINNLRHDAGIDKTEDYKINTDLMKWQQNQTKKQAELNMWGHNAEYMHGAGENVGALPIDNTTGRPISELKPSDFSFTYDSNAKTITTWSPTIAIKTMDDLYAFSYYMTSMFMFEDYGTEANSHAENITFSNRGPSQYSELGIYPATDPNTKKSYLFFRWIVPTIDTFNAANVDNTKNNINANPDKVNKQVIHLIDDTNSANKLNDMVISNPAGTVLNVSIKPPANYVLAENSTLPSTFDFTHGDLPDLTVHVNHDIEIVNDTRNNATETIRIHYVDNKGNKLKDDTIVKFTFHRDYTIDKVTGKSTIGAWEYVPNSMTQTGTYVKDIGEPGKHYNSVNGYDSFNFWIPFNVSIPEYNQKYSGLTASLSIPNESNYLYDGNLNVDQNIVYDRNKAKNFTINIYDDDLGTNGKPIGVVGTINPTTASGYATVAYKWPNNAKASLADYIISQIPDLPDKVTIAGDFWRTLKVGDDATSLSNPNWRIADFDTVRGKTFTIHIKSAYSSVIYNFIDATTNQVVGKYDLGKVKADSDVTIDKNRFKRAIPDHYYLNRNYDIPENIVASESTMTINVPVHKAYVYTITFYDETAQKAYNGNLTWDGIDDDKHLTGTVNTVNTWIDNQIDNLVYDVSDYDLSKVDITKLPPVATLGDISWYDKDLDMDHMIAKDESGRISPFTSLPEQDVEITVPFTHNFSDLKGYAPIFTPSSVYAENDENLKDFIKTLNSGYFDDPRDWANSASDKLDKLQVKWTAGGTLDDTWSDQSAFAGGYVFNPTYQWPRISHIDKYLQNSVINHNPNINERPNEPDPTVDVAFGTPYMIPMSTKNYDLFDRKASESIHFDLSGVLPAVSEKHNGYHAEVLTGVYDKTTKRTKWELIPVNNTDVRDETSIFDLLNKELNVTFGKTLDKSKISSLSDVDGELLNKIGGDNMRLHINNISVEIVPTNTGRYEYGLISSVNGLFDLEPTHILENPSILSENTAIDELVPYISVMYREALKKAAKQSNMSDLDYMMSGSGSIGFMNPSVMLYTIAPNDETATIKYIDDDTGETLKQDTIDGKFDSVILFTTDPSAVISEYEKQGYKVVSNNYKSGAKFNSSNNFEVHLTKKIDNTINYVDNDGKVVKTDKVTDIPGSNIKLNIPDGYHIEGNLPKLTISSKTPVQTVNVIENKHETGVPETSDKDVLNVVNYVDENGKTVKTDKITGKDGDNIKIVIPDDYHVDGQIPSLTVNSKTPVQIVNIVKDKHETGTPETSDKDVLNVVNYVDSNGKIVKTDKVVGEPNNKIDITIPDGYHIDGDMPSLIVDKDKPVQTVNIIENKHEIGTPETISKDTLNIINYIDGNGKIIKTDKITGNPNDKISIEIPDGYHINGQVPNLVINSTKPVQTVNIVQNKHETDTPDTISKDTLNIINYVDGNGKIIKTDKITGNPNDKISIKVPDGYHIEGQVPALTIDSSKPVQTVNIVKNKHDIDTPDTINKDTLNIINYVDENGKVIKTDKITGKPNDKISIEIPDDYHIEGQVPELTINSTKPVQTVNIVKNKHDTGTAETISKDTLNIINYVDENGKVIKTDKITGKPNDKISIEIPDGYHIEGQVPELTIDSTKPVQTVNVVENKYDIDTPDTINKDTLNIINYVDENGKVVKTDKITGKPNDKISIEIPDGYHIEGQVPELTINSTKPVQTVNIVKNKHDTGTAETISKDTLNIINYVDKNGKVVKTDKITGKPNDKISIEIPDGYHIEGQVPELTINSTKPVQTVNIVKNKHDIDTPDTINKDTLNIINYVDENGKVIKTDKITGKPNDKISIEIPDGYHIEGQVPELTIDSTKPVQTVNIVKNKHDTGTAETISKDTLNIINYVDENGKVIKTDKITGKPNDKISIEIPDGYHIEGQVPELTIDSTKPVQTVNVVENKYDIDTPDTINKDTLNIINYVDENGKVIKTDKITGKPNDKISIEIPDGYHIEGQVPELTIDSTKPVQTVNVVENKYDIDTPDTINKDTLNIINYVDENGKVIKTDKITGKPNDKISIEIPDDYHIEGQVPELTINSTKPVQTVNIVKNKHDTGTAETISKDTLNIINYVDKNGKVVKTDKITGKSNDKISIEIPDGYYIDGQVPELTINITKPVQAVNVVENKHKTDTSKAHAKLPQTNSKSTALLNALGTLLTLGSSMLLIKRKRRKNK